jgi:hypothetical protein
MAKTTMRRCTGSARFGIEPHDAPVADFTAQPSRKDGLAAMCKPHWSAYVKGLAAERKARAEDVEPAIAREAAKGRAKRAEAKASTKAERRRSPMANKPEPKPESPRVRKARETLAATEALAGPAYTEAVGSPEVQEAIEVVNGHGPAEPDDGHVLVAGVLYDSETLEEAETPLGETIDSGTEEADAE